MIHIVFEQDTGRIVSRCIVSDGQADVVQGEAHHGVLSFDDGTPIPDINTHMVDVATRQVIKKFTPLG